MTRNDELKNLTARIERIEVALGISSAHSDFKLSITEMIDRLMLRLGFPQTRGAQFLRTAILICYIHPDYSTYGNLQNILYPILADIYRVSPSHIQRDMHYAIETSFSSFASFYNDLFHFEFPDRPSNSDFLKRCTHFLLGC